jgi:hypothetical protein
MVRPRRRRSEENSSESEERFRVLSSDAVSSSGEVLMNTGSFSVRSFFSGFDTYTTVLKKLLMS